MLGARRTLADRPTPAGRRVLVGLLTPAGHRALVGLAEVADGRAGPAEVGGPAAIVVDDLKR